MGTQNGRLQVEPSESQTPSWGLALGVKPKARTIYSPLVFWAIEVRNTRLLWCAGRTSKRIHVITEHANHLLIAKSLHTGVNKELTV